MANNRLIFDGMAELKAALRALPAELTAEASHLVEGAANQAVAQIKAAYPMGPTGNLIKGVVVSRVDAGKYAAGALVKSSAPHAYMFENGTQARHTDLGANRGAMPPGHVFVPIIVRIRRRMYEQLKAMLSRHGLQVSGDG